MDAKMQERLRRMDGAYDQAQVPTNEANQVPDGEYHAVVDRFDFIEVDNRLKLLTEMSVAVGTHAGAKLTTWHDLEDPERIAYTKKHLAVLECEPPSLAQLEDVLKDALDAPVRVAVKTSAKGYKNVYVNQRLGQPIGDFQTQVQPAAQTPPATDPIPF